MAVTRLPWDWQQKKPIVPTGWVIVDYLADRDEWRIARFWYAPPLRLWLNTYYRIAWISTLRFELRSWWARRPRGYR